MRSFLRKLRHDNRGNVAIAFTVAAIPVIGVAGIAVDYSRAFRVQSDLQYSVDAAALAGGTKYVDAEVNATVDTAMDANSGDTMSLYDVTYATEIEPTTLTVTAETAVPTTIGAIFMDAIQVSATATAFRGTPVRIVELQVTEFNSNAWDANAIYWYIVPEDGGVPEPDDMHLFLSNDPNNPAPDVPAQIQLGLGQQLGFALVNITGGVRPYGNNSYGQPAGTVNTYYSHLEPENMQSAGASDCTSGTVEHAWDDNGGGSDDNDYDDAVYEFSCTSVQADPTTVYLIR